jgi:hypothetical protein
MEHRHQPGQFNVQLHVNAPYPSLDPGEAPFDAVILLGDLGRDGVVTEHTHYATWWSAEESLRAWQGMEDYGLPWLERYASPENLIEFYETALREGPPPAPGAEGPRPAGWLGIFKGAPATATPALEAPTDYHLWLAMLYEEIGRRDEACRHAVTLYEKTRNRCSPNELRRMERHLRALGCQS